MCDKKKTLPPLVESDIPIHLVFLDVCVLLYTYNNTILLLHTVLYQNNNNN